MRLRLSLATAALALAAVAAPLSASGPAPIPEVQNWAKSDNMTALGFSPRPTPTGTFDVNSDLAFWGDTVVQGTFAGFRLVDVTKPQRPKEIVDYSACAGDQGDVLVWDDLVVRSWNSPAPAGATCGGVPVPQGQEGLHVFDIADPQNPIVLAFVATRCGSHTATAVPDLTNDRLLVYSSGSSPACLGFDVVEVPLDDPAASSHVREVAGTMMCHDIGVLLGGPADRAACAGHGGLQVYSMDPADGGSLDDPRHLWTRTFAGVEIGHSAAFTFDGRLIVFGHEPGGGVQARCQATSAEVDRTLFFVDAETGATLGTFVHPRPQTATENCSWHNYNVVPLKNKNQKPRYALVSGNYQSGISVVEFTDPANASEVAFADPPPLSPTQLVLGGDWGSYWYNGRIYQSDITRGLFIWRVNPVLDHYYTTDYLNPQTSDLRPVFH